MGSLLKNFTNEHWQGLFEGLCSSTEKGTDHLFHPAGADVILSCKGGKVFVHKKILAKFTVLLDLIKGSGLAECSDPFGVLTIVLPDLDFTVLQALCRLIFIGDSGNLTSEGMSDIVGIIRPEYGGSQPNIVNQDENQSDVYYVDLSSPSSMVDQR